MSERLTKRKDYGCACWNGDQNLVTHRRYSEMLEALAKYEDVLYDADGNEVISLEELAQLLQSKREGRVVVLPCKVGDVVAWDNGAGSVLKLFVKAIYHDGTEARLLLKNAAGKFFDAEPLANHPALRYGAEAERALAATEPKGGLDGK